MSEISDFFSELLSETVDAYSSSERLSLTTTTAAMSGTTSSPSEILSSVSDIKSSSSELLSSAKITSFSSTTTSPSSPSSSLNTTTQHQYHSSHTPTPGEEIAKVVFMYAGFFFLFCGLVVVPSVIWCFQKRREASRRAEERERLLADLPNPEGEEGLVEQKPPKEGLWGMTGWTVVWESVKSVGSFVRRKFTVRRGWWKPEAQAGAQEVGVELDTLPKPDDEA